MAIISKILKRLKQLTGLLRLFDRNKFDREVDVLFIYSESDKQLVMGQRKVSRFLEPIKTDLLSEGFALQQTLWNSEPEVSTKNVAGNPEISLRSLHVSYLLSYFFLRFICTPKIIVVIDMKHRFYMAARRLNIKVVESLHGFNISENHDRLSINSAITCCPDAFLAYDDLSARTLLENRHRNFQVHRVQHPKINQGPVSQAIKTDKTKKIIFTLAWGYDGEYAPYNGIIDNGIIHSEVIKTIKARTDIFWIIRLHPVQLNSQKRLSIFKFLNGQFGNLNHVDFTNFNLTDVIDIFDQCNVHITMRSSAIAEAALVNCPTITLCPSASKNGDTVLFRFNELINAGSVTHTLLKKEAISAEIDQVIERFNRPEITKKDFQETENIHDKASNVIKYYLNKINTKCEC